MRPCFVVDFCTADTLRDSFPSEQHPVARGRRTTARRRIPKPRLLRRSPVQRIDVTRGEYNDIIDILNERNVILNGLRNAVTELQEAVTRLERSSDIQFKRIAQLQADLDFIKQAWDRMKMRA